MLAKTYGSAIYGVNAVQIVIEVNELSGVKYYIVGLPDNAVKESLQRVESAIKEMGFKMPRRKLVINLSPADIKKTGSAFDLPIAMGIIGATRQLNCVLKFEDYIMMGELNLDGTIQPVKGALAMAIMAEAEGFKGIILPSANVEEASVIKGFSVLGADSLDEVVAFFENRKQLISAHDLSRENISRVSEPSYDDFEDVKGQFAVKRALEVAAAGGHNIMMIGPPGAGKTMLAKRLPGILPLLSLKEAIETTKIHSIAGRLPAQHQIIQIAPFRAPHHSISDVALVGGGSFPQPGEISLAHHGVLFLDELAEFKRTALEVLRQPLEEGKVNLSRAKMSVEYPSSFILAASMNPCPCGYFNHPEKKCTCSPQMVQKYLNKVSGPLLDRIDIHIEVQPLKIEELHSTRTGEASAAIRNRVKLARTIQNQRFIDDTISLNAQMNKKQLSEYCRINDDSMQLLKVAMRQLHLSGRAYDRILKLSRTIADLANEVEINISHVAEAIHYRSLDRQKWFSE